MAAPKRNRYAAKPRDERHTEALYIRLRKDDKQRILEAAGNAAVTDWARRVLLAAARSPVRDSEPYACPVPTVLRIGSNRFHFYSDEGVGPSHIHVRTNDGESKFWLEPIIGLARNHGVRPADLRRIEQLVFEHHDQLLRAFNEFHNR